MSSTRHAKAGSPLRQERYLSSPEFERGLKALPVARRCELISNRLERELIWWLQFKSQQEGGLAAVVSELVRRNPEATCTPAMRNFGLVPSQRYNAEQVRSVRKELGADPRRNILQMLNSPEQFPLRGECPPWDGFCTDEENERRKRDAMKAPDSYPASDFLQHCRRIASIALPEALENYCLDPKAELSDSAPWYFNKLRSALFALMKAEADEHRARLVVTQIGRKVHRCLDIAHKTRSLVIINGVARIGKSFAAETWCQQHPGAARFVEVPPSNDDIGFFRAIARGLGLGNFLNYKAAEIRERVESVLITGQLLLVLDEAHRCWPQRNPRYGFPSRIEWIMSMVNKHVPICALTTPQFFSHQQRSESTGWASEQFTGRITHHEQLPAELSKADLEAVARNVLPEAGDLEVSALVAYARSSAKYLAAIDSIARYARYLAEEDGRTEVRRADIQRAMRDGVIPSDRSLAGAIQAASPKRGKRFLMDVQAPVTPPLSEASEPEEMPEPGGGRREIAPAQVAEISTVRHGRAVRPAGDLVGA